MSVLLLNATYEPLAVIPHKRAISLLLRGRVEGVSQEIIPFTGSQTIFEIPQVLRLRRFVSVPQRGVSWSRLGIMRRDNYTCIYCGVRLGQLQRGRVLTKQEFTIDHIMPKSRGGANTWGNTACACTSCNNRKGDRLPHEANLKLSWEPKRPRVDYWVADGHVPEAWKLYLEV